MILARLALVSLLVSACGGGGGARPTPRPGGPAAGGDGADPGDCRSDYAEYEQRWRLARSQELAEMPNPMTPDSIEVVVSDEVETLPAVRELETLRLMYALILVFIPDAPWVVAFSAAERAIATCGERARRPS
jgi:hypothetical protein